jgi:hypothetical protein
MSIENSCPYGEAPLVSEAPREYELRFLDPARVRFFEHAGHTRMTLLEDRSWVKVTVMRAQPLTDPSHYYGVLDGAGKDIGMIRDPGHLDAESRRVVEAQLEERYFTPRVLRVLSVKEEYGAVYWRFDTDRGEKEVVARNLRDSLQELGASRVFLTDVDGNRYDIPDLNALDPRSLSIILRHL